VSKRVAANEKTGFAVLGTTEISRPDPLLCYAEVNRNTAIHIDWMGWVSVRSGSSGIYFATKPRSIYVSSRIKCEVNPF